jgi:hypothetical protein
LKLQLLQADINSSWQILDITNFGCNEEFFSCDGGLFYGNTDLFFVAVTLCTVNMTDTLLNGTFDYLNKLFVETWVLLSFL